MHGDGILVGNALYFNYQRNTRILEYDLGSQGHCPHGNGGWWAVFCYCTGLQTLFVFCYSWNLDAYLCYRKMGVRNMAPFRPLFFILVIE